MNEEELKKVLKRWKKTHKPEDFETLYNSHDGLLKSVLIKYPGHIHTSLVPRLVGLYIESLYSFDDTSPISLSCWALSWMQKINRTAHHLLWPGIPESKLRARQESS